jgi:hypothetical protein
MAHSHTLLAVIGGAEGVERLCGGRRLCERSKRLLLCVTVCNFATLQETCLILIFENLVITSCQKTQLVHSQGSGVRHRQHYRMYCTFLTVLATLMTYNVCEEVAHGCVRSKCDSSGNIMILKIW